MKVKVADSFEIKPGMRGTAHAPGLVVVFDGSECADDLPRVGTRVTLQPPAGQPVEAVVSEIKRHGTGVSFFFGGLTRSHVPIGSNISWQEASARIRSGATGA